MLKKKNNQSQDASQPSGNWYKDRYQYTIVQRNILVIVSMLALVVALGAVATVLSLSPLKSVEPFVIQVDEKKGITKTVFDRRGDNITSVEAINDYFIVKYIRSRETFDVSDLRINYETVRLMSKRDVYREFVEQRGENNPAAPLNLLTVNGRRSVKINSVSYLPSPERSAVGQQVVNVRMEMTDKLPERAPTTKSYIATMTFEYNQQLGLTTAERYLNPLAFRVVSYRLEEEYR